MLKVVGRGILLILLVGLLWLYWRQQAGGIFSEQTSIDPQIFPKNSSGRKPSGTREDPFVGIGEVLASVDQPNGLVRLLVQHEEIPYFMVKMSMPIVVPKEVGAGISKGDLVTLYCSKLIPGSELALLYAKHRERPPKDWKGPIVYFGYEIRVEKREK